jgi:hypothetical protein
MALVIYRRCFWTALVTPQHAQVKVGQSELLATLVVGDGSSEEQEGSIS